MTTCIVSTLKAISLYLSIIVIIILFHAQDGWSKSFGKSIFDSALAAEKTSSSHVLLLLHLCVILLRVYYKSVDLSSASVTVTNAAICRHRNRRGPRGTHEDPRGFSSTSAKFTVKNSSSNQLASGAHVVYTYIISNILFIHSQFTKTEKTRIFHFPMNEEKINRKLNIMTIENT